MLLSDLIRRAGRSLRSAKVRTLLTAMAIAVGTFALTLTLAASNGAQEFVSKIIADNFDPAELIVANDKSIFGRADTTKPQEYDPSFGSSTTNAGATTQIKRISDEDIERIKNTKNVEQVREDISVNLQYVTREGQKKFIGTVQGLSPAQNPETVAGKIPRPLQTNGILLPEAFVESLGFSSANDAVGKKVTLAIRKPITPQVLQSQIGNAQPDAEELARISEANSVKEEFTIAAVLKKPTTSQPGTELYMYVGGDDARRINDITTQGTADYRKYTIVFARVKGGEDQATLNAVRDDLREQGFSAQSVKDTQDFLNQIIGVLQGIVAAFGAIAVIASVFGIVNTMYISVLQRTREIGLMKALGMRKKDIGRLFRFEAAWIGFLGGLIGSLLALGIGTALNPWITTKLELGKGSSLLIFKPQQMILLVLLLMIVSTLAGWLPSRKAAKLDPIEALRTE